MGAVVHGNGLRGNLEPDTDPLFNALAAGGTVDMPLQVMFWGSYFGSLSDRISTH